MTGSVLSCDLYAPCQLDWETEEQLIRVTEETAFPYDGRVSLALDMPRAQRFTLRLRIPHYVHGPVDILLNGQPIGQGTGHSKKEAEQAAANAAIERLEGK